jgi:Flp pilus assembly protein TadB
MESNLNNTQQKTSTVIGKAGSGIKAYLCNWRNLLTHGLLGVALLVAAIWAPINPWLKMVIIACLVCFNVWRMRSRKAKQQVSKQADEVHT